MKKQIIDLKNKGKSYNEICEILKCSKSTVAWHCSKKVRENSYVYRNKNRRKNRKELKISFGAKCCVCGYDKCLSSLHFHHKDKQTKVGIISYIINNVGLAAAREESKKCILVCGNCHGELHEGLLKIK